MVGYEVPGEYLDDETFAAMLAEAQKYIGYPYVWGGSFLIGANHIKFTICNLRSKYVSCANIVQI